MSEATPSYFPASPVSFARREPSSEGEVCVFVGMFQGLVSAVEVYREEADADAAFARFCGVAYADFAAERVALNFKYEGSIVYVVPVQ